jgi:hypothetical protein
VFGLLHGGVRTGRVSNGLTDEDGKAGERKTVGNIVDYIYDGAVVVCSENCSSSP